MADGPSTLRLPFGLRDLRPLPVLLDEPQDIGLVLILLQDGLAAPAGPCLQALDPFLLVPRQPAVHADVAHFRQQADLLRLAPLRFEEHRAAAHPVAVARAVLVALDQFRLLGVIQCWCVHSSHSAAKTIL